MHSLPVAHHAVTLRRLSTIAAAVALLGLSCAPARAIEVQNYGFEAAAQEVTQLFWLAETASACGWASAQDIEAFKLFSVKFLAAHLSDRNRMALLSLVTEDGYEDRVRRAALEGAVHNCGSNRWRLGWSSYKNAADEHASDF